jgi:hypothetical protein
MIQNVTGPHKSFYLTVYSVLMVLLLGAVSSVLVIVLVLWYMAITLGGINQGMKRFDTRTRQIEQRLAEMDQKLKHGHD